MTDAKKHELLMAEFTPPEGYEIDHYYGVTMMVRKKTADYSLQLQFDYAKRAKNSNSLILTDLAKALTVYKLLMKYAKVSKELPKDLSYI